MAMVEFYIIFGYTCSCICHKNMYGGHPISSDSDLIKQNLLDVIIQLNSHVPTCIYYGPTSTEKYINQTVAATVAGQLKTRTQMTIAATLNAFFTAQFHRHS